MSNDKNNASGLKVKSNKEAFFPHPRALRKKSTNIQLIIGVFLIGLLIGVAITAGIILGV